MRTRTAILLMIAVFLMPGLARAQTTTVSATGITDKNGNPYTGTITPVQVVATGQPQTFYSPVALNSVGAFSTTVQSNVSYIFTVCTTPTPLGPTVNLTPKQVCFSTSTPILVNGASLDITAQLQAAASAVPILGPQIASVTSVGLSMPVEFNVSGSPVTSSGTLTATKGNQSANTVYAGTASGVAAAPGFRAPVPADFAAGSNCGANNFVNGIGAALALNCAQPSFSNLSGTIASSQFGSQSGNTFLAAPNGSAGNPSFRAMVGTDMPAANLATSGNGGVTGNLPVGNLKEGADFLAIASRYTKREMAERLN